MYQAFASTAHALSASADPQAEMNEHSADFTGRLPADLYRAALDLALVFNQSLSRYLAGAINAYVDAQLTRRVVASAVQKVREARGNRSSERRPRATSQRMLHRNQDGGGEPSTGEKK